MPTDAFVISVVGAEQDYIEAVYLWDEGKLHKPRRLPRGTGLSWHIIETGEPLLAYDYMTQADVQSVNVSHYGSEKQVRSLLAVPMQVGKRTIGMLSAQSYLAHHYTIADQEILDMLAAYAAIALDNARLFSEVQKLAIPDGLTGTYNRRYFFDVAQKEISRARRYRHPVSVLILDIDRYKDINDTYGHDVGDHVLREITQRCCGQLRRSDVFARYGGDEFVALCPETDIQQCVEIAERLRHFLEGSPMQFGENKLAITISVGVSGAKTEIPDIGTLLKCADIALYEAKDAGRNRVKVNRCMPTT
jgi:diguanylate cyclase (GGDEF)-like protein